MLCHLYTSLVFVQTGPSVVRVASELLNRQGEAALLLLLPLSQALRLQEGASYHITQGMWFWRLNPGPLHTGQARVPRAEFQSQSLHLIPPDSSLSDPEARFLARLAG